MIQGSQGGMGSLQIEGYRVKEALMSTFTSPNFNLNKPTERPDAAGGLHVALEKVHMAFGSRVVLESLSCGFPRNRISVILGGSGSGKSTILRLIGGLIHPQSGAVIVDGQDVTGLSERGMQTTRRKLGMVFQGGALLDSYTVFDNVALPLREQRKLTPEQIAGEVHATLAAVDVSDADDLLPGQLSGGMLRRVALARAIIRKPTILLCDEPFSGLDPVSIKRIESLLVTVNRQFGITLIVVSHHVPSTMRMADHVLLLLEGNPVEGSPAHLRQSKDATVADFLDEGMEYPAGAGRVR
jgi:phospholipid/cholesterol/gamma-HCH transport system ATP-binding protein